MRYLLVKDLIEQLNTYDPNIPVVVTDEGKDHQYGLDGDRFKIIKSPYFGNDLDAEEAFGDAEEFLNIANM